MGLRYIANNDNKAVDEPLRVIYSIHPVNGYWSWTNSANEIFWRYTMFEYHRYAVTRYRYVGMEYEAACSKANQLRTQYTRGYKVSDFNITGNKAGTFTILDGGTKLQGNISVRKQVGHLYEVVVDINEDDVHMHHNCTDYPHNLFIDEDRTREYDY